MINRMNGAAGRAGSVLAIVLAVILTVGLLGTSFAKRVSQGNRMAGWSRDHLSLRLVAESAIEELWLELQDQANNPGNPVFERLRTAGAGAEVELTGLATTSLAADLAGAERVFGGAIKLTHRATLLKTVSLSGDSGEIAGLVRLEATARVDRGKLPLCERVRCDRSFQVARTVLPAPLDTLALFVLDPDVPALPRAPMQAAADQSARTLIKMFTDKRFKPVPAELSRSVAAALDTFSPDALSRRAQFVTADARQLMPFLGRRLTAGKPVSGLVFNKSPKLLELPPIQGFRGRLILATPGDVRLSEISIEQPGRDSLTIVAGGRILVDGRTVEANLITLTPGKGVVFARQARVAGTMISSRFPRGPRLSRQEMEQCEFGTLAGLDSKEPLAQYFVTFSPHPVSVEHRRQGEEWSEW